MAINKRVSLRKFTDDIRRWVEEDKSDEWIASALGTSPSSVQSFRSRNAIYRRHATTSTLYGPQDFSLLRRRARTRGPGVWFDPEISNDPRWQKCWKSTERVELRLTPTRIVFLRRGAPRTRRPVSERFGKRRPQGEACRRGVPARHFAACQHFLAERARSSCGTRSLSRRTRSRSA